MSVDTVTANPATQIANAIGRAARSTGASFEYLLTTAQIESRLDSTAQAPTSSAKGLFQFIEQTWLGTLKQAGRALGFGDYADAIVPTPDGRYAVPDPAARDAIMRLRNDPTASAMMAGAFARANADQVGAAIGRAPTESELYMAHFLGSEGAARLISAAANSPRTNAVAMFPQAAAANRSVFFDRFGQARSASAVYAELTNRYQRARAVAFTPELRGTVSPPQAKTNPAPWPAVTAEVAGVSDTAAVTQAFADARDEQPRPAARHFFETMFSDRGGGAVANTVSSLWTGAKRAGPQPAQGSTDVAAPLPGGAINPLDLFVDGTRRARALFGGKG